MRANFDNVPLLPHQKLPSPLFNLAVGVVDWLIVRVFDLKLIVRVFDHNNDGSISKEELREAMVNFGTRCTEE